MSDPKTARAVVTLPAAPLVLVALGLLVALFVFAGRTPEEAEAAEQKVETRFIAVTGEGSTAVGWFEGATPPGLPLQTSLAKLADDGFRVVEVTMPHQAETTKGYIWYVLLERVVP